MRETFLSLTPVTWKSQPRVGRCLAVRQAMTTDVFCLFSSSRQTPSVRNQLLFLNGSSEYSSPFAYHLPCCDQASSHLTPCFLTKNQLLWVRSDIAHS